MGYGNLPPMFHVAYWHKMNFEDNPHTSLWAVLCRNILLSAELQPYHHADGHMHLLMDKRTQLMLTSYAVTSSMGAPPFTFEAPVLASL